uniref:unspecific monooxygenase n=1 Tax=Epiphyas postvittana TaxID=65032 RepID=A0A0K8TVS7_EPIPO
MYHIVLLVAIFALTFLYLRGRYNEAYWKKRGVAFYEKNKVFGVYWDFLFNDKAMFQAFHGVYKRYRSEPAVGVGSLMTPSLYLIDPQNIQHVVQSDFQAFSHSGLTYEKDDLLADNVLFMSGPRWKLMRQKMSPLFTAAKLRNMYYIMDKSAKDFVDHLRENPEKLKGGYDTVNEFCSAALAGAVFGIGTESTFKSPFLKMARDAVKLNWKTNLKFAVNGVSASISSLLRIRFFQEHEKFFIGSIKQVLRTREKENTKKHDFADICLSLQKAGAMRDQETGQELEPTDELLAAQGFFFFLAGVEPAAAGMFGTLMELGKSPDILKKVQQEIDETMEKYDGKMTYEIVSEMKYLDQVLSEALRMHTPVGFLTRQCTNDSVLPVGNIRVSKGTNVFIPIYELHYDPKYHPQPEVFDPDRFSPENRAKTEMAYLPFGRGGRVCIGMRYARLQLLAGLLHLLRNYDVVSHVDKNSREYVKGQFQVRRTNIRVELIPRNMK